jgi:Na+/phosphate symporter
MLISSPKKNHQTLEPNMKTLLVTALLNAEQEIMAVYDSFEDALAAAEGTQPYRSR